MRLVYMNYASSPASMEIIKIIRQLADDEMLQRNAMQCKVLFSTALGG